MSYRHGIAKVVPLVLAAGLAGCATEPRSYPEMGQQPYPTTSSTSRSYYSTGQVERIEVVRKGAGSNVAGTVIGGIVGGVIGSQIGSGSGRTAATIAGAAGGAIAGNVIEGRSRTPDEDFRVTVRMDDGTLFTVVQEDLSDLRTGDRVRVDGNRVVRI